MTGHPSVEVVGRFPPPIDGQALATARLAELLASPEGGAFDVGRHDVGAGHVGASGVDRMRRLGDYLTVPSHLRRSLGRRPPSVVLWPSVSPTAPGHVRDRALVLPALADRPVVGVAHVGDFDRLFRAPLTARSARALVRRLRALVFLSEGLADRCAPFVPDAKRVVIPNTTDRDATPTEAEVEAARRARRERGGLRLLFLSSLTPAKGVLEVIESASILVKRGRAVSLRIVGPGDPSAIRDRITALGLGEHAEVLGEITDRAAVRALMLEADVLVFPTRYAHEAQPLVVLEALAAGTPVVTTRVGALHETIADGTEGRLVEPAPSAIADAVEALAAPGVWEAASVAARQRYDDQFSAEVVGARWQTLLSPLGSGGSGAGRP